VTTYKHLSMNRCNTSFTARDGNQTKGKQICQLTSTLFKYGSREAKRDTVKCMKTIKQKYPIEQTHGKIVP